MLHSIHFIYNTEHAMANINSIHELHINPSIFTQVRARTDRQTEVKHFSIIWKVSKTASGTSFCGHGKLQLGLKSILKHTTYAIIIQ